ncbi:B3 domain-containing protein LOC_Os12g40080-like isoform X2 [Triticum urartu]|uniref:TF-B3 domain-containing protein n=1 Tax=Triticum urartu TaxID=4572 RepID=A0A8R7U0H4_TRIUA|nr:B3 domain-containing protein LOC_Os12g40080-like isoform X2 [Triticum urartu]
MEELEFFMILLPNFLKKLRLPGKFTKVLAGRERREVKLREDGRQRRLWDVEVVTDADGHMYLGHGWEHFAHAHDMRLGHFLVLSYDGHAVLTVKVFDGSMCRRHYQHDNDASGGSSSDRGNTLGSEGEGEAPPHTGAEEDDRSQGISQMSNPCDSDGSQKERSFSSDPEDPVDSANLQMLSNNYVLSVQCYLTKAQKVKIDALIEKTQPKITVLVVQMKKSNVKRHANLVIQKDYALKHFPREDIVVILQLPGKNKDWKSTFRIRPSGVPDAGRCNLYLGNFACDNHVREGDICLFQPMTNVKERRFIVKVHILHKASVDGTTQSPAGEGPDSDGCLKEGSSHNYKSASTPAVSYTSKEFSEENPPADEAMELDDLQTLSKDYVLSGKCDLTVAQGAKINALIDKIRPEIPVLVIQMKKSSANRATLIIQKDYALKYFPCEDTTIILQLPRKNKNWKCKFHIRAPSMCNAGRRTLYLGKFVHDTHVREGDICLFQPMTNVMHRRFIVTVHLLHKESIAHSPGGRTDIGSNHGSTSAKMGGVKEEPPADDEEYEVSENSEEASENLFMFADRVCITPAQELKLLEKVEEIKFKPPFYVAIMSRSTVCQHGPMLCFGWQYAARYLVQKFAAACHRGEDGPISLVLQREGKSRSWPTKLQYRRRTLDTTNRMTVLKGWPSFARDNHLRERDLCLFKLMDNEEQLTMMVYIVRR